MTSINADSRAVFILVPKAAGSIMEVTYNGISFYEKPKEDE